MGWLFWLIVGGGIGAVICLSTIMIIVYKGPRW